MRTLTAGQQAEIISTVTTPGFFVKIDFTAVLRLSSRNDQIWDGYTWTGGRLGKVSGLAWDNRGIQTGSLEIANTDLAYSALILNEGIADKAITIWKFYGDNPAASDPTMVFSGVGDDVDIGQDIVRISLVSDNANRAGSPRRFIGAATGFNHLTPAGSEFTWGGQKYVLDRAISG